jgi:acetylornithine aminotransferase
MSHLMNTYARLPVAFVRGEGVWLYDEQGKPYLDALAGIAVSTLGHGHPRLVEAIARQAKAVIHTSNLYRIPAQERLADRLCELSGMDEVFFGNSGAEANECAIKLARFYGHKVKKVDTPKIAVMEQAFHGRTLATLSATGNVKTQLGFEPLVSGFLRVPFGDIAALTRLIAETPELVAVMFEVIQGEGGIRLADPEYLRAVRSLCDAHGLLMICDEVQCGLGRTGKWFGWQWSEMRPDVMTLAKGLGSGVPIGACLAAGPAAALLDNAARVGGYLKATLAARLAHLPQVKGVRGQGLMLGVELDRPCAALVLDALEAGLLINVTAERVIRLLPPLILSIEEAQQIVERLVPLVERFVARH